MLSSDFKIDAGNNNIPERELLYSLINKIGNKKKIPKGRSIVRIGSPATFFFLIEKGVCQTSTFVDGKKYSLGFTFIGDVDVCPIALLQGTVNNFLIESVTEVEVLTCNLQDFKKNCSEIEYYKITSQILTYYLSVVEKRLIDSISMTAEKRYLHLLKMQPDKVKQIPLASIASYLGISQERLSRIRKKLQLI